MKRVKLSGKPAIEIKAELVTWGNNPGGRAKLYKINEQEVWVPNSLHSFEKSPDNNPNVGNTEGTITVAEWFYNKNF